jgi:hypothetical protein
MLGQMRRAHSRPGTRKVNEYDICPIYCLHLCTWLYVEEKNRMKREISGIDNIGSFNYNWFQSGLTD